MGRAGTDEEVQQEPGFYRFGWFYDYSGGKSPTLVFITSPKFTHHSASMRVVGTSRLGGKFANYDSREVPDTLEVLWHYPNDTLVTFSQFNATGARAAAAEAV